MGEGELERTFYTPLSKNRITPNTSHNKTDEPDVLTVFILFLPAARQRHRILILALFLICIQRLGGGIVSRCEPHDTFDKLAGDVDGARTAKLIDPIQIIVFNLEPSLLFPRPHYSLTWAPASINQGCQWLAERVAVSSSSLPQQDVVIIVRLRVSLYTKP